MTREERRIRSISEALRKFPATPAYGFEATIGVDAYDDCAVVQLTAELDLVIGSDFVRGEGFHLFKRGLLSRHDIGYYLMGANASDLAAMGATPIGATVAYRYTEDTTDEQHRQVMEGVAEACRDFKMPLLGGDSGGYEAPVLSASAFGVCPHGRALLRSNGRPDDLLFLTGPTGIAGAALSYFTSNKSHDNPMRNDTRVALLQPWKRIQPALDQGQLLVDLGIARCAIDTSDGLKTACRQLARASSVDVILDQQSIPIVPAVREVAEALSLNALSLTCGDSVDFRLLFSIHASNLDRLLAEFTSRRWPLHQVGSMVRGNGSGNVYLSEAGSLVELPGAERE